MDKNIIKVLRISLAFAFLYPAISGFISPVKWIGYLPSFIADISFLTPAISLMIMEIIQIIVALWLLFGKNPYYPGILASLLLAGIIVFNLNLFEIVFRDIALLLVSIALVIHGYGLRTKDLLDNNKQNV